MKEIARGYAYWPGMDKDIEGIVEDCLKYQIEGELSTSRKSNPLATNEETMESSVCRFRRSHQWSNLPSFGGFSLQMARSYCNVVDKCLGHYQCP